VGNAGPGRTLVTQKKYQWTAQNIAGCKPKYAVVCWPCAQNEAESTVLRYVSRSWVMIANQIDRYVEIVKKGAAQKK
jgi:hypothetical protein